MSLAIDPATVTSSTQAHSTSDSYEFVDADKYLLHGGGDSGVCATGYSFTLEDGESHMAGPLTTIRSVRYSQR